MAEGFICDVEGSSRFFVGTGRGVFHEEQPYRSACEGLGFYDEHEGKRYCVLHFPGEEKKDDLRRVLECKLAQKDYDFGGTVFPEGTSDFERAEFGANARFAGATFLGGANFREAQFSAEQTSFSEAQFRGERTDFTKAHFSGGGWTYFANTQFRSAWTNFSEVQFSSGKGTSFSEAQFRGRHTEFTAAQFSGEATNFPEVEFSSEWTEFTEAQFSSKGTTFRGAQFSGGWTSFSGAPFRGERTNFSEAQFSGEETSFVGTGFGSTETRFQQATFMEKVVFSGATFGEKVDFWGSKTNPVFASEAGAWFASVLIQKPKLLTFNTVLLHPSWFINTDVRKVNFTDVQWYGVPGGPEGTLDEEISTLKKGRVKTPHPLLAQACRRLSANAEENREYPLANAFHYWSMDVLRKDRWDYLIWVRKWISKSGLRVERRCGLTTTLRLVWDRIRRRQRRPRSRFGLINTLYWALSGYGVRAGRALGVLLTIAIVFAVLYMIVGHPSLRVLPIEGIWRVLADAVRAVMYSLGVMARLRPEPIPKEMGLFQIFVTVEGILGPLQIALLALAIRRQVMR